jgi:NAD(P)-dependent dehydrogenase (short-subunit alcohol dehydrogenase family)
LTIYRDKVAVVTGAGSGIGRALARDLATRGAKLAISDVNESGLAETLGLLTGSGHRSYRVDVSKRDEVFGHAEAVVRDFGAVHFVFNNAGVTLGATIDHATIEEIEWQLSINLWGPIYGTKAFLPLFLARREGHIVNISSIFGMVGIAGQGPYNISKFGVRALTECLWRELRGTGVSAVSVHPGGIATNIAKTARLGVNAGAWEHKMARGVDKMLSTPPEVAARDILDGVAKGKRRILTGNGARIIDWIARLFPSRQVEVLGKLLRA